MVEVSDVVARGDALYESVVRARVEPQFDGEYVAIQVDSGDYEVARSAPDVIRAMRQRRPAEGRLYLRKIGDEPEYEWIRRLALDDKMLAARAEIVASGVPLLTMEEIECEIRERRGGHDPDLY